MRIDSARGISDLSIGIRRVVGIRQKCFSMFQTTGPIQAKGQYIV